MTDEQRKPEGRPMAEILRLVAEDDARFDELEEAWHELTVAEQVELVKTANAMRASG